MITVHQKLSLTKTHRGRRRIEPRPEEQPVKPTSSVPRISRLMALAIKYQGMLDRGEVAGITELARLCRVTQPRMTQILNLNLLSPSIQEQLLLLPPHTSGKQDIHEKKLRSVCSITDWSDQQLEFARYGKPKE
jgi:hypothetical protein